MAIFEITPNSLREIPGSSFAKEGLRERDDLQRLLKQSIENIAPDTMILAEEFGSWERSLRRIDLLGLDKERRLVVIELKRSEDGGHMELQALRYAAMVSSMSAKQAIDAHRTYLDSCGHHSIDALESIEKFLEAPFEALEPQVRIVLASADFSKEITTAVLWLNSSGLDIRCVRMQPHSLDGNRVLLDIQQIIPLLEAADYQVAIREKAVEVQAAALRSSKDLTKFDLTIGTVLHTKLPKRDFVFYVIQEAIRRGFKPDEIHGAMPWTTSSLLIGVHGTLEGDSYVAAIAQFPNRDPKRYFCASDELFHIDGWTYALTNQWGPSSESVVQAMIKLMGNPPEISYAVSS